MDHKSSGAAACEMLESYVVYLRDYKTVMTHTYDPNALGLKPLGFVYRVSFREEKHLEEVILISQLLVAAWFGLGFRVSL